MSSSESTSWLPITAVAASSSLTPGRMTIGRSGTVAAAADASSWNVADRRALVAGDERRGVQAVAAVDAQLVDGQAGERLHAGEEDPAVLEPEAVGSS